MTKRGSSFGLRAVMYLGGELALDFLIGEVFISFEECSEDLFILFFSFCLNTLSFLYTGLVTIY